MSAACSRLAEMMSLAEARLADTISPAGSRALKEHATTCSACARGVLEIDPTLLFASLALEGPSRRDENDSRRLRDDILSAIELERARRRIARPSRRVVLQAASVVLLAGTLLALLQAARTPQAPKLVQEAAAPRPGSLAALPPAARPGPAPVLIDHLRNPGATVYQFASTSAEEPNIVFVVDRNADI